MDFITNINEYEFELNGEEYKLTLNYNHHSSVASYHILVSKLVQRKTYSGIIENYIGTKDLEDELPEVFAKDEFSANIIFENYIEYIRNYF